MFLNIWTMPMQIQSLNMMGHFTFCAKNAQWEKYMMHKQILNRKKDTELLTLKKKSVTIFSAS